MSHISKIAVEIKDLAALKATCKALGMEWSERKSYKWWGRWMRDSPLPEGIKEEDLGKCDYVMSVPGNTKAYEVGVVKNKDKPGYTLLYDFWSRGYGLEDKIGRGATKLVQGYSEACATAIYRKQPGFRSLSRIVKPDGKVVLTATFGNR